MEYAAVIHRSPGSRPFGRWLRTVLADPLATFVAVGGAFFLAYAVIEHQARPPVRYTAETEAALVTDFEAVVGRKVTQADRARLRNEWIADEVLFREALARGMHLTDGQTRKRLTDKLRYLVAGAPPEPGEEDMVDWYSEHTDLYMAEPKVSFTQVFFEKRPADPAAVTAALERGENVTGDAFWQGGQFARYGISMIRGIFGQPFVERLGAAPMGHWTGPIETPRGWHYVRKTETVARALAPYPEVREQVREDIMAGQTRSAVEQEINRLKEKYDVEIGG